MNGKDIVTGLNHVDEAFVEEAGVKTVPGKKRQGFLRWSSAAAAIVLVLVLVMNLVSTPVQAEDLMAGIRSNPVEPVSLDRGTPKVMEFGLRLLEQAKTENRNTLISPVSVLYALAMTANGAQGQTLAEMEAVLGMQTQELNEWLFSFRRSVNVSQLKTANSIWFTAAQTFTVKEAFLQTNADYFCASLYKTPFDGTTLQDINNWCADKTDGMIPKILDEIPQEMVMYLINALCFDAEWAEKYEADQVRPDQFHLANGQQIVTEFLFSEESTVLMDDHAVGFIKTYKGGKYGFAALLPEEGMHVYQYLETLTGEKLNTILSRSVESPVSVAIPSFETQTEAELIDALREMGIIQLFDKDTADLSGLGTSTEGNIWVGEFLHKTYIKLDAHGTKAAAISIGGASAPTAMPVPPKQIYLDRPFVYMIVDLESGVPVFLGIMMNPTA